MLVEAVELLWNNGKPLEYINHVLIFDEARTSPNHRPRLIIESHMELLKAFQMTIVSAALTVMLVISSVKGQISTPCTTSMISSFTPCANLITGSTNNGTTPSSTCCESLRSLVNTSSDCACLVISANVPMQLPISPALALSLPRACNLNALPAQCKASGSPLPAPGPAVRRGKGLTPPPIAAASPSSPQASKEMGETKVAKFESRRLAEAEAPVQVEVPTKTPRIRPIMTPPSSASSPSFVSLSPFVLVFIGVMVVSITY